MNTKKAIRILVMGICIFAVIALSLYISMKVGASAKIHATSGVYVFNRASDGARFTCDLRANGVCFGSLEIPGTEYSAVGGDIPAALIRGGNGATGAHGLESKWEIRNGKVYLFTDGHKSAELVIQGRNLMKDGFTYVRAE
jgi:hypothetical protein